jgi:transposase
MRIQLNNSTVKKLSRLEDEACRRAAIDVVLQIQAIRAFSLGTSPLDVATLLHVSPALTEGWKVSWILKGLSSVILSDPSKQGPKPKLTRGQIDILMNCLSKPPSLFDLGEGCWTSRQVNRLSEKLFQVSGSKQWACNKLKQAGFSYQKTISESPKRNPEIRDCWISEVWPKIVEEAEKNGDEIVFGDGARFLQRGTSNRAWAPIGQPAKVKLSDSKKGMSVLAGIEWSDGKIYGTIYEDTVDSAAFIYFLEQMLDSTENHVHLIIDQAPYHRSEETWSFVKANSHRLTIHFLPAYSPDFNPIEKLWSRWKNNYLNDRFFKTLDELRDSIIDVFQKFKAKASKVLKIFEEYPILHEAL